MCIQFFFLKISQCSQLSSNYTSYNPFTPDLIGPTMLCEASLTIQPLNFNRFFLSFLIICHRFNFCLILYAYWIHFSNSLSIDKNVKVVHLIYVNCQDRGNYFQLGKGRFPRRGDICIGLE